MYRCTAAGRIAGRTILTGLCLPAMLLASHPALAQGDLLIAPTRLVLDGRQGGEVILNNIGGKEATYRITLELRRMTPDGDLEEVAKENANPTEQAALEMVAVPFRGECVGVRFVGYRRMAPLPAAMPASISGSWTPSARISSSPSPHFWRSWPLSSG